MPVQMTRLQIPVRVCYAMTVNKSQGQTLAMVGLYLTTPIFSCGQLYVAISRVTHPRTLFIQPFTETIDQCRNVACRQLIHELHLTPP